ncbi:M48 family metallopeptidase [Azoarcus sp. L1K30]|uniref:M48 family metallopeptidase n=1 Tax=Azoarcus sp. L1K30 TaxID=2820277 RepID=UPI001B834301|nr:M48 family metallopeptidase [Azoarcus sp. L1K30]MBR0568035.1 M48 family metallopeptidase [Azoarcus sp. L1K30]
MFDLRPRLARALAAIALAGLLAVSLLLLLSFCGVLLSLQHSWSALISGDPVSTAVSSVSAVVCAYLCARIASMLCVSPPEPAGVRLPRDAAPEFYTLIDDIGRQLSADGIDHVWITRDPNASVLQRARLGCLGRIETHLLVGLPLVHSVSRAQLAAVMAHEFAHLALQRKGTGKLGAHLRAWWLRVLDAMCEDMPLMAPAVDRFLRRFYRDLLRLSRIEEFEADAHAARLVGAGLLGETLVEVSLKERFLRQDYWPKVMAQSETRVRPTIRPYREMGLGVETGFLRPESVRAATEALMADGDEVPLPFHPALHQRLRALRVPLRAASVDRPSAARHYFAPILPALSWVFDRAWWQDARPGWRRHYRGARRRSQD